MRFIKIQGEEYPIKFGLKNLKELLKKAGTNKLLEAEKVITGMEIDDIPGVLKMGLDNAANILGDQPPFSLDEVEAAFDCDLSLMTRTIEMFSADLNGDPDPEPKKKKGPVYKGKEKN